MATILLTVCLAFLIGLQQGTTSGELFGICVETCSLDPADPYGFGGCEEGYVCKSTGCGHTCQLAAPEKSARGACIIACSSVPDPEPFGLPTCAEGYECRSNGCGVTCQRVPAVPEKKSVLGACVITCSDGSDLLDLPACAEGYQCKFNGCGRTCQLIPAVPEKKAVFGSCIEACSPALNMLGLSDCAEGYVCRSNGCGHTCQLEVAKRQRCAPVLCELHCLKGFALDEHECEICKCQE